MVMPLQMRQASHKIRHMTNFLLILYLICATLLALYTVGQFILLWQYLRYRSESPTEMVFSGASLPSVTVQLPLYNEQYVVKRLLDATTRLDYPKDKLIIQILDDSTDDTPSIVTHWIGQFASRGYQIEHVRRTNRNGFKAGALADGLRHINTPYVAIFDADFVPPSDFLQRTIPALVQDDSIGMVQTRWGHLNGDENWLTKAQRLAVDAHFTIEQTGRHVSNWLLPFNGTGGVWRVQCIEDAGGWSDETLTEDFDLSYRAQLRGWKMHYLPQVMVPGELPHNLSAYKQQQARWATGSTQCLQKLLLPVWRASHLSWMTRLMATHHLSQYLPQVWMLMLLALTVPLLPTGALNHLPLAPLSIISFIPPLLFAISQRALYDNWQKHLLAFPALILIATGLTWSNSKAVMRGTIKRRAIFERTPKRGDAQHLGGYALRSNLPLGDLFWAVYAFVGVIFAFQYAIEVMPYMLLYALAYTTVFIGQLRDVVASNQFASLSHDNLS